MSILTIVIIIFIANAVIALVSNGTSALAGLAKTGVICVILFAAFSYVTTGTIQLPL